jgi:hypothetical protein
MSEVPSEQGGRPARLGRAIATYSGARIGLFVLAGAVIYGAGIHRLLLCLLAALVISGLLSYVLLNRQREAFGQAVERRWRQRRHHPVADRRAREESYAAAFQAEQDARERR